VSLRGHPGHDARALAKLFERTRKAAYEIISRKGATYYAIGLALAELAGAILRDEGRVFPVSTLLRGYHGVRDVCLSVPCVLGRGGAVRQVVLPLDAREKAALRKSADFVRSFTP
jgi:L-lactate dehydrogenase